jgi:hypothetical protein
MDKFYYIVAQLPTLFFNKEADITMDAFLAESEKWMSGKEYNMLSNADINDTSIRKNDHTVLVIYKNFESRVRNDIVNWRKANHLDQNYNPSSFPISLIRDGNPLEIERNLLELRWAFIDGMEREHHFDLGVLILYYLKLQILKRFFTFDRQKGLKKFRSLYEVNV